MLILKENSSKINSSNREKGNKSEISHSVINNKKIEKTKTSIIEQTRFSKSNRDKMSLGSFGLINLQNILVQNLKYGEYVYYCLNMLCSINDNFIDIGQIE